MYTRVCARARASCTPGLLDVHELDVVGEVVQERLTVPLTVRLQ